jgi:hypothetical protein
VPYKCILYIARNAKIKIEIPHFKQNRFSFCLEHVKYNKNRAKGGK